MLQKKLSFWVCTLVLVLSSFSVSAATIELSEYSLNIDGTIGMVQPEVNDSLFNAVSGLGILTATIEGIGSHNVDVFFDHEMTESGNTFFNETGMSVGAATVGQSWEIDEPGWINGDIYENFTSSNLDGGVGVSIYGNTLFPEDVSMAMGWDFSLTQDEKAVISFSLSEIMPNNSAFYLVHSDPVSDQNIYLSSTLQISAVPEPSILLLFGVGFVGLAIGSRRRKS